jgi:formylglycine-generating enzyme required for sulfatase activity
MENNNSTISETTKKWIFLAIISVLSVVIIYVAYNAGKNKASSNVKFATPTESGNAGSGNTGKVKVSSTEMILIPAGKFKMGTDDVDASGKSQEFGFNEPLYLNEQPMREIMLEDYFFDKFEVSSGQFLEFIRALGKYSDADIQQLKERLQLQNEKLPVRNITWKKADEYCRYVGKRLPTESEWEKAARGTDGREYPWGNDWNPEFVNKGEGESDVMPVGSIEKGKSPYGIYEMAGNVMEWTADWYEAYPGASYKSPNYGNKRKVARGGSWGGVGHYVIPHYFRAAYRFNFPADQAFNDVGFRCAKNANS